MTTMNWLDQLKEVALGKAQTLRQPDIKKVKFKRWPLHLKAQPSATTTLTLPLNASANTLLQVQGTTTQLSLSQDLVEQGVIFCDFKTALEEQPKLVEQYFNATIKDDDNQFLAENTAWFENGLFLYLPKNLVLTEPLNYYLVQANAQLASRLLIVADVNSQSQLFTHFLSQVEQGSTVNIVTEVIAEANSQLEIMSFDQFNNQVTSYLRRKALVKNDATVNWSIACLNQGNTLNDFASDLMGRGASTEIKVTALANDKQTQGINTRINNLAPYTKGNILQYGAVFGRASLTFNGIGHIFKTAPQAAAQQESRVLMLSAQGQGHANPILLIDQNDVIAGHAASVGQVDENQLYYLQSRGLTKDQAQRLLVLGFFTPVINAINNQTLKETILQNLEGRIQH